jgi:hypothetical protein
MVFFLCSACSFRPFAFSRKARADGRPVGVVFRGHHEAPGGGSGPVRRKDGTRGRATDLKTQRRIEEGNSRRTSSSQAAPEQASLKHDTRQRASAARFNQGPGSDVSASGTERSEEAQDVEQFTSAFAAKSECREMKARSQARFRRESSTFRRIRRTPATRCGKVEVSRES